MKRLVLLAMEQGEGCMIHYACLFVVFFAPVLHLSLAQMMTQICFQISALARLSTMGVCDVCVRMTGEDVCGGATSSSGTLPLLLSST